MSKWPDIVLTSPWGRISLVPPQPELDAEVAAFRSDPEALRYVPFLPKSITAADWRAKREAAATSDDIWNFYIHLTAPAPGAPSFAGLCGLFFLDPANRAGEVGISVAPRLHRTGIASEALALVLAHAFDHPALRLHRVQFVTAATNAPMRACLERAGVPPEHTLREAWDDGQGGRLDCVGYSVLAHEWPALHARLAARLGAPTGAAPSHVMVAD